MAMEGEDTVVPIELASGSVGAAIAVGVTPVAIAIAPDGRSANVVSANNDELTRIDLESGATAPISVGPRPIGIAIPPLQSPRAGFTAVPATAVQPTRFDASASTADGAAPATYEWDFGDGASLSAATPVVQHTYSRPGSHTATLTVRNACAPGAVFAGPISFTGQTAYCNGPATDRESRQVAIPAATPSPAPAAHCPRLLERRRPQPAPGAAPPPPRGATPGNAREAGARDHRRRGLRRPAEQPADDPHPRGQGAGSARGSLRGGRRRGELGAAPEDGLLRPARRGLDVRAVVEAALDQLASLPHRTDPQTPIDGIEDTRAIIGEPPPRGSPMHRESGRPRRSH